MNVHDSERIMGILEKNGYVPFLNNKENTKIPDLVIFNTCAIRKNAENKLYGHLNMLNNLKKKKPEMKIAVGGCLGQKDKAKIVQKAPYVDIVFGTNNLHSLPVLLKRSYWNAKAQVEILESLKIFPSSLPTKRQYKYSALVSISVGCNNTCSFCIVPYLKGKEKDRLPSEILQEIKVLVDSGVKEITLLGQNVNTYGISFGKRNAFCNLLKECGKIKNLKRLRFMSPHPSSFDKNIINVMQNIKNIMPHLHMPLQSGSDRILKAMRRSYRISKFLTIIEYVKRTIHNVSISSDIIIGFPGETEEDFQETLNIVKKCRFSNLFIFEYSSRPHTKAFFLPFKISKEIIKSRFKRLLNLQNQISFEENKKYIGSTIEILTIPINKKRKGIDYVLGRAQDNRLVYVILSNNKEKVTIKNGEIMLVNVIDCSYKYLIALVSEKQILTLTNKTAANHSTSSPGIFKNKSSKFFIGFPIMKKNKKELKNVQTFCNEKIG